MQPVTKYKKQWIIATISSMVMLWISILSYGQGNPTDSLPGDPGALNVYTIQNLSFGAFTNGLVGGTVTISNAGTRSVTGNVVALNLGTLYFQSIFDIEAPSGSIISITNGSDAVLSGSNGGSMIMHIGASDPPSPFVTVVTPPARTQVSIGGTLSVGGSGADPPGTYSGTFYLTFNVE
jgi:Domain of unknown function (DUF4402)